MLISLALSSEKTRLSPKEKNYGSKWEKVKIFSLDDNLIIV
jgi:hypothetical protein